MWKPTEHSEQENTDYTWLRAIEWDAWPFFLSQPAVPVLLLQFEWWEILIGLVLVQFIWTTFIRTNITNIRLAGAGAMFVLLKWIACPIAAYKLYETEQITLAALALLWPLIMMLLIKPVVWIFMAFALAPFKIRMSQIGVIQRKFMREFGYTSFEDPAP